MNFEDENGGSFVAIHGATEGFMSSTVITLKALRDKSAQAECKEDSIALLDQFITGYTKAQESFLGRTFIKRKDSTSDNGDKP